MDKVKQILTVLRKYHFWILCTLVALVGLIIWYSSSGKLDAEFKKDSAVINQTFSSLKQIQSPHPNDTWVEGIGKKTDEVRKQVKDVWDELYKQQKKEVFVWPKSLGKEFLDAVAALDANPNDKLSDKLRERYQNMVKQEAGKLAEIVDAPPVQANASSNQQGAADNPDQGEHRVKWAQLADIQSSFDWEESPSTQMIEYMQEELWVYEALCKVIKAVNEGSTNAHDTPITTITEMAIAYPAVEEPYGGAGGRIKRAKSGSAASPAAAGGEAAKQRPDLKTRGTKEGQSGTEGDDPDAAWKNFRYVKDTGEPLMAADLANASPEYNLMPFRLQLTINPRDLDRFLVACRNSVLPIEVREVRINVNALSSNAAAHMETASSETRRMEKVEIDGVVYLIKPPDPQKLGIAPTAESATPGSAEAPTGAPAGAAPPPAEAPPAEAPKGS